MWKSSEKLGGDCPTGVFAYIKNGNLLDFQSVFDELEEGYDAGD